jgi:hypothetical protein
MSLTMNGVGLVLEVIMASQGSAVGRSRSAAG